MDSLPKNILVVDDGTLAADILAKLLRVLGWRAESVYSASDARKYLADVETDLILLDIGMPGIDGYQFATILRKEMRLTLPIIALTGYSYDEDHEKMFASGFTAYLTKPVGMKELQETLNRFLVS